MTNAPQGNKKVRTIGIVMILAALLGMITNFIMLLGGGVMIGLLHLIANTKADSVSKIDKFNSILTEKFQMNYSPEEIELFMNTYKNTMIMNLSIVFILNTIIGILTILIANSWRKGDLFGTSVTKYLKWMGIVFLTAFTYSFTGSFFIDSPVGHIYLTIIHLEPGMGNFATGLFLLALSYVLKYGNTLEEEVSHTV